HRRHDRPPRHPRRRGRPSLPAEAVQGRRPARAVADGVREPRDGGRVMRAAPISRRALLASVGLVACARLRTPAARSPPPPAPPTRAAPPAHPAVSPDAPGPLEGEARSLVGAGATFPAPLYARWFEEYRRVGGVEVTYQAIGSGGGIKSIADGTVDFGAS